MTGESEELGKAQKRANQPNLSCPLPYFSVTVVNLAAFLIQLCSHTSQAILFAEILICPYLGCL